MNSQENTNSAKAATDTFVSKSRGVYREVVTGWDTTKPQRQLRRCGLGLVSNSLCITMHHYASPATSSQELGL